MSGFNEKTVFVPVFLGLLLCHPSFLANDQHTVSVWLCTNSSQFIEKIAIAKICEALILNIVTSSMRPGMLGSFTATRNENGRTTPERGKLQNGSDSVDYGFSMFGPTYRF